jgi:hypothetical protein
LAAGAAFVAIKPGGIGGPAINDHNIKLESES